MNESRRPLLKELEKRLEALLEINDADVFIQRSWSLQMGSTTRKNPRGFQSRKKS